MADNEELIQIDVNDVTFVDVPETTIFSQGEQGPPGLSIQLGDTGYVKWSGSVLSASPTVPWTDLSGVPATFTPSAHQHPWSDITGTPTTLAGYGITDALTKVAADGFYQPIGSYALVGDSYTKTQADARFSPIAVPWLSITGKPTTATGYGIASIDAVPIGATTRSTGAFSQLGVGLSAAANVGLQINIGTVSGADLTAVYTSGVIGSGTTTQQFIYRANVSTAAAAFTLPTFAMFYADTLTLGASSAVTTVRGFFASNNIAKGASNYGFYSDFNDVGANTQWAFYSGGTAPSYMGPRIILGSTSGYGLNYRIRLNAGGGGANLMSGASQYMFAAHFDTFQADCTGEGVVFYANIGTAANIVLTDLKGVYMSALTVGSGGTIANVYGAYVHANFLKSTTSNFAFYTNANDGSNTFAFYSAGSAASRFVGSVGIGNAVGTTGTALNVSVTSTMTGASLTPINLSFTAPATATVGMSGMFGTFATAAAAFTIPEINAYRLNQFSLGAGSAVTALNGFYVNSLYTNDVAGTTVKGFLSLLNKGTNATVWQLYMGGNADSYFNGGVNFGTTAGVAAAGAQVRILGAQTHPQTTVTIVGLHADYTVPSTATTGAYQFYSVLRTTATAFTLATACHFFADNVVVGAGSTVGSAYGFFASANFGASTATNVHGFHSEIASGTGKYQLFMNGTAGNYLNGQTGIGTAVVTSDPWLYVGGGSAHPQAGTTLSGIKFDYLAPATAATGIAYGIVGLLRTAASAFTLASFRYFTAENAVIGAGSTVTNVYGFMARNAMAAGSSNFGFYSDIALNGTSNYQCYMGGTALSFFGGLVGILNTNPGGNSAILQVGSGAAVHPATGTTGVSVYSDTVAPATMTSSLNGYQSTLRTIASAFTISTVTHFAAGLTNLGAGSTITTLRGFHASNSIAVGGTNYAYYTDFASATNTWAFYASGTAPSYFGGVVSILNNAQPAILLAVGPGTHPSSATTIYGVNTSFTAPSTATVQMFGFRSALSTAAAVFTLGEVDHFCAVSTTVGATSAITTIKGFYAANAIVNATAGSTSYGFYSDLNNPAAGTAFAFYQQGNATSIFKGPVLHTAASATFGYGTGAGGTVTQATSKATGVSLSTACGQITMNAAALAAATIVSFVVTNTQVAATDYIHVQHQSGGTLGAYGINASAGAGSFTVQVRNNTAGSLSEAIVLSFAVIKGATS